MAIFKIGALSSLIMAAALAGCASGGYDAGKQTTPAASTTYRQPNSTYTPNFMASTSAGRVMTTPQGATVYTFDNDQNGKPSCYAECAKLWPPVTADSEAEAYGQMSLAMREDGQRQWLYDGMPLYTYVEDSMHGDVKGNNMGSVWHVVK